MVENKRNIHLLKTVFQLSFLLTNITFRFIMYKTFQEANGTVSRKKSSGPGTMIRSLEQKL